MNKLQSIQKFVAQIVTRSHNITPVPKQLNKWPPVATQIYFRNTVVALTCLTSRMPEYLSTQYPEQGWNKQVYRKKFTGTEYSAFQVYKWLKDH